MSSAFHFKRNSIKQTSTKQVWLVPGIKPKIKYIESSASRTSSRCAVSGFHKTSTLCIFTKPVSSSFATANKDGSRLLYAISKDSLDSLQRASIK